MTPEVRHGYLLPYDGYSHRVAVLRFIQDIPLHPGHPTYPLVEFVQNSLPQFRGRPMLVLWGMRDFCFNERFLEGWIERFPQAEVHRFADAGHYVVEDAAEEVIAHVRRFLASCPG